MPPNTGDWAEWSRHVLAELERLNRCYESLDSRMQKINETVTVLRVQASLWGALGGSIGGIFCGVIVAFIVKGIIK